MVAYMRLYFPGLFTNLFENRLINQTPLISNTFKILSRNTTSTAHKDLPDPSINNPYSKERRQCILCKHNIKVNYKNPKLLSQFVSPYTGRIYDKHITGLCDAQQKLVVREITKSRLTGFMAYTMKEAKFLKDEKIFNPARPIRPNPH